MKNGHPVLGTKFNSRTEQVRPNVACLRVDAHYALEALGGGERRAVAKVEEVVVLQPLRQRLEVGHLPLGQLVPG